MIERAVHASSLENVRQRHHPDCFVCDPGRAFGLRVPYIFQPEGITVAEVACPSAWEGYPGLVHGGIIASLIDGAMTNCLFGHGIAAVTADLQLRYRHSVKLGAVACVTAELTRRSSPLFVLKAAICQDGRVCVTGTGKFMTQRRKQDVAS